MLRRLQPARARDRGPPPASVALAHLLLDIVQVGVQLGDILEDAACRDSFDDVEHLADCGLRIHDRDSATARLDRLARANEAADASAAEILQPTQIENEP